MVDLQNKEVALKFNSYDDHEHRSYGSLTQKWKVLMSGRGSAILELSNRLFHRTVVSSIVTKTLHKRGSFSLVIKVRWRTFTGR